MAYAAFALGAFQIVFLVNAFGSLRSAAVRRRTSGGATTLEWASGEAPRAYRAPYEYSVPGAPLDYIPPHERANV